MSDIEVDEEDELYTEAGIEIRAIIGELNGEVRLVNYFLLDKTNNEYLDFALEEDEEAMIKSYREEANASIMHLSSDEASEIVYLAYLADKCYTAADYAAACKRCPKLLKPVAEFKTEIGKRLKSAMEAGGMLPKK